jgi:hypothetical protein
MQAIRGDKEARTRAYHRALADRAHLPRLLRMLDLRLAADLAAMAVGSVADAVSALHAAASPLSDQPGGCGGEDATEGGAGGTRAGGGSLRDQGVKNAAPLLTHLVVGPDGSSIAFSPTEAEWMAALEAEMVAASLDVAASVQPLLALPAFERLRGALAADGQGGQYQPAGAAQLAWQDATLPAARDSLAATVRRSYAQAEALAQRYHRYLEVHSFAQAWDFEGWAARQR